MKCYGSYNPSFSMGNIINSTDSEEIRESLGSSVDPVHLQKSTHVHVPNSIKRNNINRDVTLSEIENKDIRLSASDLQEDRGENYVEIQGTYQAVESSKDTSKTYNAYDEIRDKIENTSESHEDLFESIGRNSLGELPSPDERDTCATVGDKINNTRKGNEKDDFFVGNFQKDSRFVALSQSTEKFRQLDKDIIKAEAGHELKISNEKEKLHKDGKTAGDSCGPFTESCDDMSCDIHNSSGVCNESCKSKGEKKVELLPSPKIHEVDCSYTDDDKLNDIWKHDVICKFLPKRDNYDGKMSASYENSDHKSDNDMSECMDCEGPQRKNECERLKIKMQSTEKGYGPVIEPYDDFQYSASNTSGHTGSKNSSPTKDKELRSLERKIMLECSSVKGVYLPGGVEDDDTLDGSEEKDFKHSKASADLLRLVKTCSESVDSLAQNNREIMELVNKRSRSQKKLDNEGLKIIKELESIVQKSTDRRKEKENALTELKLILSTLTANVKKLEQEIKTLQSKRGSETDRGLKSNKFQNSRNVVSVKCSTSSTKQALTKNPSEDLKQPDQLNSENIDKHSHGRVSLTSDLESGVVSHSLLLDKGDDDNEDGIKHLNPNKTGDDSSGSVEERIKTARKPTLESDSPLKRSSIERSEQVKDPITTNTGDKSSNFENESDSSTRQDDNPEPLPVSVSSNIQENSQTLQSEANSRNIQENNPNLGREQGSPSNTLDKPNIVVRQSTKGHRQILPDGYWNKKSSELQQMLIQEGPPDNFCGWNTVLCLDISDSMRGDAFKTMIRLALRFISGIDEESDDEKIGVVCFGEDTRMISRCCLNYTRLLQEIRNLKPGGPSPLTAGLLFSLIVLGSGVKIPVVKDVLFFPRIIILSDGMATPELIAGPEDFSPSVLELSTIKAHAKSLARQFRNHSNRIYFVPLGQANESVIGPLVSITHGKVVRPSEFETLIHQFHGETIAAQIRPFFRDFRRADASMVRTVIEASNASLRGISMDNLVEYVRNPPPQRRRNSDEDGDDDDNDENDYSEFSTDMPPIGTRVRRGPDWEPSFDMQDSNGPGTVVSQDPAGYLSVIWDNGHRNNYPYGIMGHFAVMAVDEPRVLRPDQFIEPGCLVRRGNDWRDNNHDGGPGSIGVVFKVHQDATVRVRWPTGELRRYKYGKQGYFEVELCDPFDEDVRFRMLSMNFHDSSDIGGSQESDHVRIEDLINSDDRSRDDNDILDEMNRKNATRSKLSHEQMSVSSDHPQDGKTEGQTERVGTRVEQSSDIDENNMHTVIRESSNLIPNSSGRLDSSVENSNNRRATSDVIQRVVDEDSLNLENSTHSRSSSPKDLARRRESGEPSTGHSAEQEDQEVAGTVLWQIFDRDEGWRDFSKDISSRLERTFLKNPREMISYVKNKTRYHIDLSRMTHVDPVTKEVAAVRRKP